MQNSELEKKSNRLLSCPFCGGKPFVYTTGNVSCGFYVEIICENCGCRTDRAYEEVATEAWNTRKPMERILEQLEESMNDAKNLWDNDEYYIGLANGYEGAIEIVKGGVDNAG